MVNPRKYQVLYKLCLVLSGQNFIMCVFVCVRIAQLTQAQGSGRRVNGSGWVRATTLWLQKRSISKTPLRDVSLNMLVLALSKSAFQF